MQVILWLRANKSGTKQNWLPWQRPLPNWKMRSRFIKIANISPVDPEIFDQIRQSFWPCRTRRSQMSSVNTWSYWTEFHEILTRYIVNAHIEVVIYHSVSECQSDESEEFAIFFTQECPRDALVSID